MKLRTAVLATLLTAASVGQAPPANIPAGLWQSQEEGFVVRIEPCGKGFCGVAVGAPKDGKHKPDETCGKILLKDFVWDTHKWVGKLQPPDMQRTLNSEIETDDKTYVRLRAHMMMMSKTLNFHPYSGRLGDKCQMD